MNKDQNESTNSQVPLTKNNGMPASHFGVPMHCVSEGVTSHAWTAPSSRSRARALESDVSGRRLHLCLLLASLAKALRKKYFFALRCTVTGFCVEYFMILCHDSRHASLWAMRNRRRHHRVC